MKLTFKQSAFAALASVALVLGVGSAFFPGFNSNLVVSRAVNSDLVGHTITFTRGSDSDPHCSYAKSGGSSGPGVYVTGKNLPGNTYIYAYIGNSYTASSGICTLRPNNDSTLKFTKNMAGSEEFLFQTINSITVVADYDGGSSLTDGYTLRIQYSIDGVSFTDYDLSGFAKKNDGSSCTATILSSTLSSYPINRIRVLNNTSSSLRLRSVALNLDCSYSYVEPIFITGISLNKSSTTLVVDDEETLTATVTGTGAYDSTVTWSSSDDEIATVDANGVVTAVSAGSVTITATSNEDNDYSASCTVNVRAINNITVSTAPTNLFYTEGDDFDPTGLVIRVYYSDSTNTTIAYSGHESDFTFAPSTNLQTSDTSVSITYHGKTCSQTISVASQGGGSVIANALVDHGAFNMTCSQSSQIIGVLTFTSLTAGTLQVQNTNSFTAWTENQTFNWSISNDNITVSFTNVSSPSYSSHAHLETTNSLTITFNGNNEITNLSLPLTNSQARTLIYSA